MVSVLRDTDGVGVETKAISENASDSTRPSTDAVWQNDK